MFSEEMNTDGGFVFSREVRGIYMKLTCILWEGVCEEIMM